MTEAFPRAQGRWTGQYGWAVGDQILSSGTNFAVAVIVARSAGPSEYGVFVLVVGIWLVLMGIGRSLLMQPYTLRAAPASKGEWQAETRVAGGATLGLGLAAGLGLVCLGLGVGYRSGLGGAFIVVGAFAAPLMLQEFWRVAAFSRGSARQAFVNDAAWAAAQIAALAGFAAAGALDSRRALVAWGLGALSGALLGPFQFRLLPALSRRTLAWAAEASRLGGWFSLDVMAYALGDQASIWIVAGVAGTVAVGGLQGVSNLFGPVYVLSRAAEAVTLPRAAAAHAEAGPRGVREVAVRYGAALAGVIAVYSLVAVMARGRLLALVFGEAFAGFTNLLLPIGLAAVLGGVIGGASLGLRANRWGRELVAGAGLSAVVKVLAVLGLASVWGAHGAAWGLAGAAAVQAGLLWLFLGRRHERQSRRSSGTGPGDALPQPDESLGDGDRVVDGSHSFTAEPGKLGA